MMLRQLRKHFLFFLAAILGIFFVETAEAVEMAFGTYVGNGATSRSITIAGFQPDTVIIKSSGGNLGVMRTASMVGDATKQLTAGSGLQSDRIKSLNSNGFTIGSHNEVNNNGTSYYWIA